MSDDELRAELAAPQAQVADKETIAAVQMSAFDIGSVIIIALMSAASQVTQRKARRQGRADRKYQSKRQPE